MPLVNRPWTFQNCVETIDLNTPGTNPAIVVSSFGSGGGGGSFNVGTNNVMSAPVTLLTASQLTFDGGRIELVIAMGGAAGVNTNAIAEILSAPAGTTSYTTFIGGLMMGMNTAATTGAGRYRNYRFDVRVPGNLDYLIRGQTKDTTSRIVRANAKVQGSPSRPDVFFPGVNVDSLGYKLATSLGTCFTPSTLSVTYGSWKTLGITTQHARGLMIAISGPDSSSVGQTTVFSQIGIGNGVTNAKLPGFPAISTTNDGSEFSTQYFHSDMEPVDIPAGSSILIRGWSLVTSAPQDSLAVAYVVY